MLLAKKSILKDGSFLPILLQLETMFHFPGHFLGSRRTLKKLFVRFERIFNGIVFDEKNSAGNHCAFAGERLIHSENFTFLNTRFGGHGLKD